MSFRSRSSDLANKRRPQRSGAGDYKQAEKSFVNVIQERIFVSKPCSIRLVLLTIICCTVLTVLHCPVAYHNDHGLQADSRFVLCSLPFWPLKCAFCRANENVCFPLPMQVQVHRRGVDLGERQIR